MKRLYFLVPDVDSARKIVDELLLARIEERHIHIVAKDHTALEQAHLPEAGLFEESDFVPALERGLAVGGATGLLAGITAVTFPPAGLVLGGGAILATSLLGAGLGAWVASMIGVSVPNTQLDQFQHAIDAGQLLMMVDVPKARVGEITELIKTHHPEAEVKGAEPTLHPYVD
ncbi:MAG TPA: DUF1269 domain-containing protein [Candidatus Competibacteraceae bacterium]|nr:DUF1269 domain-containing protein [Candidatus Competibacteraceae bacterium]